MSTASNLWLEDRVLSVKAALCGVFMKTRSQRTHLEKLLEVRLKRVPAGHPSLANVYEDLAHNYMGHHIDDLSHADELALEAINILEYNSRCNNRAGEKTFRMGTLIHLRSRIRQHMNQPRVALELGEEALAIYNKNNKLICHQRSAVMHTLVHLHRQVGSAERADRLALEVKILDQVLASRAARGRIGM
ncbi:MAG: hypothetical protein JSS83_13080 [Cyanobacteria bacterium SZAS LIN-3]|nr:hypothetical protein [Cyanobacteria bacterium SZAS LIN-3]